MQDLLLRYFGTPDLDNVDPAALPAGIDRMLVDFGLERDRGRRFALWSLLYILDAAPDVDVAFKERADQEAARTMMDMISSASED